MWKICSSRSDKRAAAAQRALQLAESDARLNELERLQGNQEAHLAAIAIAEIFTPSMVEDLQSAIQRIPFKSWETNRKVEESILLGRRNTLHLTVGGIGVGHPPGFDGLMVNDTDYTDNSIPEEIDAVRTTRYGLAPSLTVLVTVFSITSPVDDLTEIMRRNYQTRQDYYNSKWKDRFNSVVYRLKGCKGTLVTGGHDVIWPNNVRREACEEAITRLEAACAEWMTNRFPGSFSRLQVTERPIARAITLKNARPFAGERGERDRLHALHLDERRRVWLRDPDKRSQSDWALCTDFFDGRPNTVIAAGQIDEIITNSHSEGSRSYEAAQSFQMTYGDVLARLAIDALLSQSSHGLTAIRDNSIEEDAVASAQSLAGYLLKDGLDVSTMTAEMIHEDMPNFTAISDKLAKDDGSFDPDGVALFDEIAWRTDVKAKALLRDYNSTVTVVSSYSQLAQSTTNLKLQKLVIVLAVITTLMTAATIVIGIIQIKQASHQGQSQSSSITKHQQSK